MRPLRVLHVIPTLTGGGAENFLCALLPQFDERVVQCAVMAIYPTDVPLSTEARSRIPVIKIQRRGRYDPGFFPRMVRAMREYRADVVHTHLHNGKYWGRLAAMVAGTPIVLFTEHNPCGEFRILPEIIVDYVVNQLTDGIATFAEQQRSLLAKAEGLRLPKVVVIENGILLPPLPTPEKRERARQELRVSANDIAVLVVARLIKRKNQQLAIRALRHIAPDIRKRISLLILGTGEDATMLGELARSSVGSERIVLMGNRPDAVDLLYGGDLFFLPSLAEGMPLAMLEAMSVGLPVITTPWTGVSALLQGGNLGTILPDWNPKTTAAAIERFARHPTEFAMEAERAREFVRTYHDIARTARAHEAWYQNLARMHGLLAG